MIGHGQDFFSYIFPDSIRPIIGYGGIEVTMFAFLSGVGLWQSYEHSQDLKRYYKRRFKRVVVPYLAIPIIFDLILDVVIQKDFVMFIAEVSCILYWVKGRGAWFVAWILPVYIIYPFYAKLTHKRSWISLIMAGLTVVIISVLGLPTRFRSVAGATIAFLCGDFAGRLVKEDNSRMIYIMLVGILIAPLYILRIISGQAIYVCFFALVGIGLCALFSIIVEHLPIWLNGGLKAVGKVSLECYLFNIYLISISRYILGDKISSVWGIIGYSIVVVLGVTLSYFTRRLEDKYLKR